jgi:hypothetical protein
MASQPSTAVATLPTEENERFGLMQREAKLFAASPLIPQHLRQGGPEQAMANCYIALKMARTMGEDPLVVLQNIHVVNGKAGFASQYMIARANSSGVFKGRINWRVDRGDPNNMRVTAFATLADTGEVVEFTCDIAMATAEGWTKNAKYRTMPEVMLRYRSAAFLVRFYAPDVMLGYHTSDEAEDVYHGTLPAAEPLSADMLIEQSKSVGEIVDADTGEVEAPEAEIVDQDEPERDAFGLEPLPETPAEPEQRVEESLTDKAIREARAGIKASKNASYLKGVEDKWLIARGAVDDATASEIDGLIAARRRELSGEGGK